MKILKFILLLGAMPALWYIAEPGPFWQKMLTILIGIGIGTAGFIACALIEEDMKFKKEK